MCESSILHIVKSQIKDVRYERIMDTATPKDESTSTPSSPSSESKECEYGISVINSIVKHVLGQDLLDEETDIRFNSLEEIHYTLSSYPNLLSILFQSPLVQDIISDLDLTRALIMTNPMAEKFNEMNPGFNELLYNDDYLRDVLDLLSDPRSFDDYPRTKQVIMERVESHMGFPVQFTVEYVSAASSLSRSLVA